MQFRMAFCRMAAGALVLLLTGHAAANGIVVTNVSLAQPDAAAKTVNVVFDLSWSNSWRGSENWDAAWVFVKFRAPASNTWDHAALSAKSADHAPAANGAIAAVPDGKGVFIYSAANCNGKVGYPQTKLRWNYGLNGCNLEAGAPIEVSVHAIEMVYIPAGAFCLGSGGGEARHFYHYTDGIQTTEPFLVSSEAPIAVGPSRGNLYYDCSTCGADQTGIVSNLFPKGFAAFYCMKYEISQGQYADFLNKLTGTQEGSRYVPSTASRNTIGGTTTNRSASAPDRACNWLNWSDVVAYADWAALRPMTELEFEKACRGAAVPMVYEYAWGGTNIIQLTGEVGAPGSGLETPWPATANCCYGSHWNLQGPARAGIFATTNSTRQQAGAGYYGVMELSGNVAEWCVTLGTNAGWSFMGTCGDGVLDADGNAANNPNWPVNTNTFGAGLRGGSWIDTPIQLRVSDRFYTTATTMGRKNNYGGRAVRQAP